MVLGNASVSSNKTLEELKVAEYQVTTADKVSSNKTLEELKAGSEGG